VSASSNRHRGVVVGAVAALTVVLVATLLVGPFGSPPSADAAPDLTPARIAGTDRAHTAALLAPAVLSTGAQQPTALLSTAGGFADALAAAGLAGTLGAPVLLTAPEQLLPATTAALEAHAIERVLLLGGKSAIGGAVQTALAHRGLEVERLAGAGRAGTAAQVARRLVAEAGDIGRLDGLRTVLLADGGGFADALAAGALAAAHGLPILLVSADALPAPTAAALDELAPEQAVLLGGETAISDAVSAQVSSRGIAVRRIGGANRTETAALVADEVLAAGDGAAGPVFVVRGDDFADALAAGPHAGASGAPVLLTAAPDSLGADAADWLARHCDVVTAVTVIGGAGVVGGRAAAEARQAARTCRTDVALPVVYDVAVASQTDAPALAAQVAAVLGDRRSWSTSSVLEIRRGDERPDVVFTVSPPPPACGSAPACRDGDLLHIDPRAWAAPPEAWAADLGEWRAYLVNHLLGLWLGAEPAGCSPGEATVMADLPAPGCAATAWPSYAQRAALTVASRRPVTVAFTGDIHSEGVLRQRLLAGEDPLDTVEDVLTAADLTVANLETAVGTSGSPQPGKTYTFRAPAQLVTSLARSGVDVVSLANNHALDFGREALAETLRLARQAGLATVGAGRDADEAYAPALIDVGGRRIAVVGLSHVLSAGWAAGPDRPGLASAYDEDAAVAAVARAAAQADHVVVAIHWGKELDVCPNATQRRLAAKLVAAGADIVAGHHPHVLQGLEQSGEALVAYSLGNFAWYHHHAPSRDTGILTATLPVGVAEPRFDPAEIRADGSPHLLSGAPAARIMEALATRSAGGDACG